MFFIFSCCNQPTVIRNETDAIDASGDPIQEKIHDDQSFIVSKGKKNFTIKPVADYCISARVVSKKSYSSGWESTLSPVDLALVWGKLADPASDKYISYSQRGRWYYYKYSAECPFTNNYIINHSCNNHTIPATDNIRRALKTIRTDDLIKIEGYLVNITGKINGNNVWWNTSTSRSDTGDHSCEIIYVEKLRLNNKVYL